MPACKFKTESAAQAFSSPNREFPGLGVHAEITFTRRAA